MLLCYIRSDIHTVQCACGHIAGRLTAPVSLFRQKHVRQKILSMFFYFKTRIPVTRYISQTKLKEIHGSDTIVIGTISADIADIFVYFSMPVLLVDPSAFWTSLGCIGWGYFDHISADLLCFICKQLFQLIKCPGSSLPSLCLGSFGKILFFKADAF